MDEGGYKIQYAAGICAASTMINMGMCTAWPSPAIIKLSNGSAGFQLTQEECSWVASMLSFGVLIGCILARYLADQIGRKKTLLLSNIPLMIGFAVILLVKTSIPLCIARTLAGIGGGLILVLSSVYVGEITDKKIRGALGTMLTTLFLLGALMMYSIGPYVSYVTLNCVCFSVPIITLILCAWIPESPYYYFRKNDTANAEKQLLRLKQLKSAEPIRKEMMDIQRQVNLDMERKTSMLELLRNKDYRKGLEILIVIKILQFMSGGIIVQTYLESVLALMAAAVPLGIASIICGVIQIIAGVAATLLVDRMGRKPLLIISSLGGGLSLAMVGTYFFLRHMEVAQESMKVFSLISLIGVIAFIVFYTVGCGNLPYILQCEIFPTNMRSIASSFFTILGSIMAFGTVKSYQNMIDLLGAHVVYWIFGLVGIAGAIYAYYVIPETKGKTLEEITEILTGKPMVKSEVEPLNSTKTTSVIED